MRSLSQRVGLVVLSVLFMGGFQGMMSFPPSSPSASFGDPYCVFEFLRISVSHSGGWVVFLCLFRAFLGMHSL